MAKIFFTQSPEKISVLLQDEAFASGGEGTLYKLHNSDDFAGMVAKIYHPNKLDEQKLQKVSYLIANPPFNSDNTGNEEALIWPKEALFDKEGAFAGFLMKEAKGQKLEILTSVKLPARLGKEWERFRDHDASQRLRLKVCFNIATAIRTIHAPGNYVLVDLKSDNILINSNGLIAIVDTDSAQVVENEKVICLATVATPEYTPPEFYRGIQPGNSLIEPSWDRFSMAVIFYRILFGIHPFAASCKEPFNHLNTLEEKIEAGLFVHNPGLKAQFSVIPPPHEEFNFASPEIKKLFLKAFVEGHKEADKRPTAEDWGIAFRNHPLLLTNRKLPSQNISVFNNKNWYLDALKEAVGEEKFFLEDAKAYGTNKKKSGGGCLIPVLFVFLIVFIISLIEPTVGLVILYFIYIYSGTLIPILGVLFFIYIFVKMISKNNKKSSFDVYGNKQRLDVLKNEIKILSDLLNKRQKSIKIPILKQDNQAKKLIMEEGGSIRSLKLDIQHKLNQHPELSRIKGNTAEEKMTALTSDASFAEVQKKEWMDELKKIQEELKKGTETLKKQYDDQHQNLQNQSNENKILIDDLLYSSELEYGEKIEKDLKMMQKLKRLEAEYAERFQRVK